MSVSPPSTYTALEQTLVSTVTPSTTQPSTTMTRVGERRSDAENHLGRIRLRSLQQQQNASSTARGALVQKLESKVTPPTTQPSMTMTRVGNGTVCSYTAVLRRQWHG